MRDTTEIIIVMDKSGSMGCCAADAIGGFNQFLEEQKAEPGEANLTLVLFDTTYNIPINGKPIKDVEPLTPETYRPGGNTALNDAVARAIVETGKRLSDMPEEERPNKVICVIVTDGQENSSREHTRAQIQEMVKHQEEKYDWAFIYLGANVDAFAEARHLGISPNGAVSYAAGSIGTRSAYEGSSEAVKRFRRRGKKGLVDEAWKKGVKN